MVEGCAVVGVCERGLGCQTSTPGGNCHLAYAGAQSSHSHYCLTGAGLSLPFHGYGVALNI